jgi:NADPH2:quinone reductase
MSDIPATMRAVMVRELSPDLSGCALEEVTVPTLREGEALVRVHATGLGFPDLLMTRGEYQLKPPLPSSPGMECSGTVVAVGSDVDAALVGRAVSTGARFGCMAEFLAVPADHLRPKPEALDWAEAASYRSGYLTAYVALVRRAQLRPGEWVLVHGAAGGVGLACVDLAKALGARVIATASSPEKRQAIAELYAPDAVIDSAPGFYQQVRDITGGGADVIFDPVGGDVFDESVRCIAFDGRLLVIGFTSGRIATLPSNLALIKGFSLMGVRAGEYGRRFPERGQENQAAVDRMASDGTIRPHAPIRLPLSEWAEAFRLMQERKVIGRVVLMP